MKARIRSVSEADWEPIAEIYNHYVASSFAAYPDQPVDEPAFRERQAANPRFPFFVAEVQGRVVGFACLSPFHPASTMRHSGTLTYFVRPEYTGQGIGAAFLERLLQAGSTLGITNFFAHVSSLNPGSIRFHLAHGFIECGRLVNVGVKNGEPFDMVWLQRQQA